MQREIEALLAAFLTERNKDAETMQRILTALAIGAAGRQRMMEELAAAVRAVPSAVTATQTLPIEPSGVPAHLSSDIAGAISELRARRNAAVH